MDVEELKTEFGFTKFYLINDFEANGYGATIMDTTNEEKWLVLHEGKEIPHAPKIIIGPGTGLGCAIMSYNTKEGDYNVHAGEGGHTEYAATTEQEFRLRNYAIKWLKEHDNQTLLRVSTERLTAGPALPLMYDFMREEYPDLEVICTPEAGKDRVTPESVIFGSLVTEDPLCRKVINQFFKNLAVMVGDIAIISLCYGGIYLCGGVVDGNRDYLVKEEWEFVKTLANKGRMTQRLSDIPIYVVKTPIGLDGSEQFWYLAGVNDYEEM